jgi:hypothetical protein
LLCGSFSDCAAAVPRDNIPIAIKMADRFIIQTSYRQIAFSTGWRGLR